MNYLKLLQFSSSDHPAHTRLKVNNRLFVISVILSRSVSSPAPLNDLRFSFVQQLHAKSSCEHTTSEALDYNDGRPNGHKLLSADKTTVVALDGNRSSLFSEILCKS